MTKGTTGRSSQFRRREDTDGDETNQPTAPSRRRFSKQPVRSFMNDDAAIVRNKPSSPKTRGEGAPNGLVPPPSDESNKRYETEGMLRPNNKVSKKLVATTKKVGLEIAPITRPSNSFAQERDLEFPIHPPATRKGPVGGTQRPSDQEREVADRELPPRSTALETHPELETHSVENNGNVRNHDNDSVDQTPLATAFAVEDRHHDDDIDAVIGEVFEAEALDLEAFIKCKWSWLLLPFLLVGGGGAVGLGLTLKQSQARPLTITLTPTTAPTATRVTDSPTDSPTMQPRCSLCFNRLESMIPLTELNQSHIQVAVNMDTMITCGDLMESQSTLLFSDLNCTRGQALAWRHCGCPSAPPPLENDGVCDLCPRGAPPLNQSDVCQSEDSFVSIVGTWMPDLCEQLIEEGKKSCECPTQTELRLQDFRAILAPGVLDQGTLFDESSFEYQALRWLALEDPLDLNLSSVAEGVVIERFVMALVYFGNGGANWTGEDLGFLSGSNVCEWNNGVDQELLGVGCVSGDSASIIRMANLNLTGSIPAEIGLLSKLEVLDLSDNGLTGSIPSTLQDLGFIRTLNLPGNQLTGSIPDDLFITPDLTLFAVQFNQLSGAIPASIANATSLVFFSVSSNLLEGTIPSALTRSTSLQILNVGSNLLDGPISHFSAVSAVQFVSFENNALTGTVPVSLTSSRSLALLDLSNNFLNGTIPAFNADFGSLLALDIAGNDFTGDLGELFDTVPRSLVLCRAGGNQLGGSIPTAVGQFKLLRLLELGENRLIGTIPSELGDTALSSLELHFNSLSGQLPTELGMLQNLQDMVVQGNRLTGPLPSELGNFQPGFGVLLVGQNLLSGTLPTELSNLVGMQVLDVSFNNFTGNTSTVEHLPSLIALAIAESGLEHNICNSTLNLLLFADSICDASVPLCPCCSGCCSESSCGEALFL